MCRASIGSKATDGGDPGLNEHVSLIGRSTSANWWSLLKHILHSGEATEGQSMVAGYEGRRQSILDSHRGAQLAFRMSIVVDSIPLLNGCAHDVLNGGQDLLRIRIGHQPYVYKGLGMIWQNTLVGATYWIVCGFLRLGSIQFIHMHNLDS